MFDLVLNFFINSLWLLHFLYIQCLWSFYNLSTHLWEELFDAFLRMNKIFVESLSLQMFPFSWSFFTDWVCWNVFFQLLDCATIPTVLILCRCLLRVRYLCSHLVGVVFCLIGASSLVLADHLTEKYHDGESLYTLNDQCIRFAYIVLYQLYVILLSEWFLILHWVITGYRIINNIMLLLLWFLCGPQQPSSDRTFDE